MDALGTVVVVGGIIWFLYWLVTRSSGADGDRAGTPAGFSTGSMHGSGHVCPNCGLDLAPDARFCATCGHVRDLDPAEELHGVAFVLRELSDGRLRDALTLGWRQRLAAHYTARARELGARLGRQGVAAPVAEPAPSRPATPPTPAPATPLPARPAPRTPAAAMRQPAARAPVPVVPRTAGLPASPWAGRKPRPERAPRPPRPPLITWHWLAEQQASLFLFAGAFLVVVAALIFVGFSGQTVDGALKLVLFAVYDLAFVAAGIACLRQPKVALAGKIFLGIGALLVPLNFVVAHTVLTEEDLDAEVMWLAASLVSAVFYSALGGTGVGKHYAYGAGIALVNAAVAVVVVTPATGEWIPFALLTLATAMSAAGVVLREPLRRRIGAAWDREGVALAGAAVLGALVVLPIANGGARWYLLATSVALLAFAWVQAAPRARHIAGSVIPVALACVTAGVAYAFEWPLGYYAVGIALASTVGVGLTRSRVPQAAGLRRCRREMLDAAGALGILAMVAASAVAILVAAEPVRFRDQVPWFLIATYILASITFASYLYRRSAGHVPTRRAAHLWLALAIGGLAPAVAFGFEATVDYYSLAFAAAGFAVLMAVTPIARYVTAAPRGAAGDFALVAEFAAAIAAAIIIGAIAVAAEDVGYEMSSRWLPSGTAALLAAFYALVMRRGLPVTGDLAPIPAARLVLALFGMAAGAAYGVEGGSEYYGVAFAATGAALVPAAWWALAWLPAGPRRTEAAMTAAVAAHAGMLLGATVATLTAGGEATYIPDSRWFTPVSFAAAVAGYAFYLAGPRPLLGRADRIATYGLGAGLVGAFGGAAHALSLPEEFGAAVFVAAAAIVFVAAAWVLPRRDRALPRSALEFDATLVSQVGLAFGAAYAVIAVIGNELADKPHPDTAWLLPVLFAAIGAVCVAQVVSGIRPYAAAAQNALAGLCASAFGVAHGIVFTAHGGPEFHALAATSTAALLVPLAFFGVGWIPAGVVRDDARRIAGAFIHLGMLAGGGVALAVAMAEDLVEPSSPWLVTATFAAAAAGYLAYVGGPRPLLGAADRLATPGLGLALALLPGSLVYALDWAPEAVSAAPVLAAGLLLGLLALVFPRRDRAIRRAALELDTIATVHVGLGVGAAAVVTWAFTTVSESAGHPGTAWLLPAVFAGIAAVLAAHLATRLDPFRDALRQATVGLVAATFGVSHGLVYALDGTAEFHAFAAMIPATLFAGMTLFGVPARLRPYAPDGWRPLVAALAQTGVAAGIITGAIVALASAGDGEFEPATPWFLAPLFALGAAAVAVEARRAPVSEKTGIVVLLVCGTALAIPYGLGAAAAYYGVALAVAGLALALVSRAPLPAWLHTDIVRAGSLIAVSLGWLMEWLYADNSGAGSGVHFTAAIVYALEAVRGGVPAIPVRESVGRFVANGWVYAAGLTVSIGYLYFGDALRTTEAELEQAALPFGGLALAFVAGAVLLRRRGRGRALEAGWHMCVVALAQSAWAIAISRDAMVATALLAGAVVTSLLVAALERKPWPAIPAVLYGFALAPAARAAFDLDPAAVPAGLALLGLLYYAGGLLARPYPLISMAVRAVGGLYLVAAAPAGLAIVAVSPDATTGSAVYQWAASLAGLAGTVAIIDAILYKRGWLAFAGSLWALSATLLWVFHFQPDSVQPYTLTAGLYLVVLGLIGLRRLHLVPAFERSAGAIEMAGAATVMLPAWLQGFDGWSFHLVVLSEALAFFAIGVVLRRRLLLATAAFFLVLVGGRALFDAVNAMPNWVTVTIAGLLLLVAGFGILLGRERWDAWQQELRLWWEEE